MKKRLRQLEDDTYRENDSPEIPPPDIVAYNELRSCADLFRMKTEGVLEIHPEFQREFVGGHRQARRTRRGGEAAGGGRRAGTGRRT